MKLAIIGATGNSGRALTRAALTAGHDVTAIVRDPGKLADLAHERLTTHVVPLTDQVALSTTLAGHGAVINAAGYVSDLTGFVPLVQNVIRATETALGEGGRLWTFGGAALLDVPGTTIMTVDLPGVPPVYEAHRTNRDALLDTTLDWSIACPGPMIPSPDGRPTDGLIVSTETWANPAPTYLRALPHLAMSLAFKRSLPRITLYYEDVASVILANLDRNGALSRKRVGIALPDGAERTKSDGLRHVGSASRS